MEKPAMEPPWKTPRSVSHFLHGSADEGNASMKIGQRVRIVSIPAELSDDPELQTRSLFERCLGRVFPIASIENGFLALDVGELSGKASYLETIYIEPECVEAE